jgi:hypothetical protein
MKAKFFTHISVEEGVIVRVNKKSLVIRLSSGPITFKSPEIIPKNHKKITEGNVVEVHCVQNKDQSYSFIVDTLELVELSKKEIKRILKDCGVSS